MLTYVFIIFLDLIYLCTAKYDKEITKSSIGCIHSLALFTSRCRKDLFRNIKDEIYWKYSKATICRPMEKNIGELVGDLRKNNQGRPPKLSVRQKRNILKQTKLLQEEMGNFCVKRAMVKAGIPPSISGETVWRVLRKAGLKWARVQRKGVLTKNDLKLRLKFPRKVRRKLPANFWEEGVGFYLDGASFTHKMNPFDQTRAPRAMALKKPGQGFDFGFIGKGSHEGTGETVAHFMAAIAYEKGVIAAEQYHGRINAETFSSFFREHFASIFKKSGKPRGKLFLQDGDPSQNRVKARSAFDEVGARKRTIPARSPDLNPIENIFHIVKSRLRQDTLDQQITREDFAAFSAKVKTTLETVPIDMVDRTILSMGKRINEIIKRKGQRIKY